MHQPLFWHWILTKLPSPNGHGFQMAQRQQVWF
jgi:hypothetical protein